MTQSITAINTQAAPKAIGPYSQAVVAGGFVFVSGQIALNPSTGSIIEGGIKDQTLQVFKNIEAILKEAGLSLNRVVKSEVYLKDFNEFAAMNEVYATFFPWRYQTRPRHGRGLQAAKGCTRGDRVYCIQRVISMIDRAGTTQLPSAARIRHLQDRYSHWADPACSQAHYALVT